MGQQPEMVSVGDDSVDAERFRTLYARHLRAVTAYCLRRIPRDRVDDAVA